MPMFLCRKSVFDGWKKWLFFGFWFIWNESLKSPEKNVVIEQKNFPITQFGGLFLSILLSYGHFSASLFLWWSWGFWLKIPVAFKDHNTKVMNKTSKYWEYRVGVSISWTHCCSTCYKLTCLKWSRNEWAATTNFQSATVYIKYSYFVHVLECYF